MGKKLPPKQLALYKAIDEILWRNWDPIGISDYESARDEYQGYLPAVFRMTLDNKSEEEIASYLSSIATERMGLSANTKVELAVAKMILSSKNKIFGPDS